MSTGSPAKKSTKKGGNKEKHVYYDDKCSKLEILLTYNGRNETLYIDNKQNISIIKEKIYNIFYPIQGKFLLIYKNKDISPFEDIPLYKYFKNLLKISITIESASSNINQNILSKNMNTSFNTSFQDMTMIDKNDASLGNSNQSQIINTQNPLVEKDRMLCNDCHKRLINYFCRNCTLFICKSCAETYSSPHKHHSTVSINVSHIEKSAKNYKDMVCKECFLSGKKFDEYNINKKNDINNNEEKKDNENKEDQKDKNSIDIDGWLNDMNTKIESLGEKYSKNDEESVNNKIVLQNEDINYELLLKKLQKINAEKNTKDLETIFNEMHDIDLNIKTIDGNLEKCLNDSENYKANNKVLKDLNKNLDNIINKLVKSIDFNEKINDNSIENI